MLTADLKTRWRTPTDTKLPEGKMMPLNFADPGAPQIVKKIGGSPEVKKHLEDLGINIGAEVIIVNTLGGNVIVRVRESRVALSDELARRIMV